MATPMRPWTRHLLDLIDSGVTEREEIIRLTIPFVPQGHAYRVRERQNDRQRRRPGDIGALPQRDRTPAEVQRIGARAVIAASIKSQVRQGYLIRDGECLRRGRR